jgi:hypothetical protein
MNNQNDDLSDEEIEEEMEFEEKEEMEFEDDLEDEYCDFEELQKTFNKTHNGIIECFERMQKNNTELLDSLQKITKMTHKDTIPNEYPLLK